MRTNFRLLVAIELQLKILVMLERSMGRHLPGAAAGRQQAQGSFRQQAASLLTGSIEVTASHRICFGRYQS